MLGVTASYPELVVGRLLQQFGRSAQAMKTRLTKNRIEAIEPGCKDIYAWDDRVSGFGLKLTPHGARIYLLKYRFGKAQRWLVLGRHGEITAEQARTKAIQARGAIANGQDPALGRDSRADNPTLMGLAERYLTEHAEARKKARSIEEDRRNLANHVLPELGALRTDRVSRQDVLRLQHKLRGTPGAANRVLALLSKMFNLAEEWGLRPDGSNHAGVSRNLRRVRGVGFFRMVSYSGSVQHSTRPKKQANIRMGLMPSGYCY